MAGYFSLVLHAHLPFVRHPEHEKFLEEIWLFEAITETYIPLLQRLEAWRNARLESRITLTLTPTLCSMLLDPLLQHRYERHLNELIELAEKETFRTQWEPPFNRLAKFYRDRLKGIRQYYHANNRNLIEAFRQAQESGQVEIITSAATHGLLPLLGSHLPSVRAQILVARDNYRLCFGRDPRGIWLPECAYAEQVEQFLLEANLRWFVLDTHGVLLAQPQPRYGTFAPVITRNGLAAFGRDKASARQVWSREEGYPGDPAYREFYRDIGFDLDFDYVKDHLPAPGQRGFTGIKYYQITGKAEAKQVYDRGAALQKAAGHASDFLRALTGSLERLAPLMDRPPLIVAPYDAELFGHWWYEGPEFLDQFLHKVSDQQSQLKLITPGDYLAFHPSNQVAQPAASSWGEEGYWRVWLNETNEWIYPHLQVAQDRMTRLAQAFEQPDELQLRVLKQAARELLLAQSSDWPFILRTGTSPDYARNRVKDHILRFTTLHEQLQAGSIDEAGLRQIEERDNLFPEVDYRYWR